MILLCGRILQGSGTFFDFLGIDIHFVAWWRLISFLENTISSSSSNITDNGLIPLGLGDIGHPYSSNSMRFFSRFRG